MPRDVHELIAESVASIVCTQFGLDLSLRSADYVANWIDDLAAFRAGMAVIHAAAASLIDAVAQALVSTIPQQVAAKGSVPPGMSPGGARWQEATEAGPLCLADGPRTLATPYDRAGRVNGSGARPTPVPASLRVGRSRSREW